VTVSRWEQQVKPNAKKRMNLRASAHPNSVVSAGRPIGAKAYATGDYGGLRARFEGCADRLFPYKKEVHVTEITSCYALCTLAETC
jgi:hypothetical protein